MFFIFYIFFPALSHPLPGGVIEWQEKKNISSEIFESIHASEMETDQM